MHIFCRYAAITFNHLIIYVQVVSCQRYPPIYYLIKDFPSDGKTFSGFVEVRVPSLALVPCSTVSSNFLRQYAKRASSIQARVSVTAYHLQRFVHICY